MSENIYPAGNTSHPLTTLRVLLAHAGPTGILHESTAALATLLVLEPWERQAHFAALRATRHLVRMPTSDLRVFRQSLFYGSTGGDE